MNITDILTEAKGYNIHFKKSIYALAALVVEKKIKRDHL